MNSMFIYSDTNKRYHTFDYYLKNRYGSKVFKVALDGGFNCPNRDGKVGTGGCIYCSKYGSGEFAGSREIDLLSQFNQGQKIMLRKWKNARSIAYFQAFTNTYASVEYLQKCFEPFIGLKDVVGITIATRPDCLPNDVLDYLEDINRRTDLFVELGLQTSFDETAVLINRGYNYETFVKAVCDLHRRKIKEVVHLINGLPGETKEMMIETVKRISALPISGIKFHCLNVLKNTVLADQYSNKEITLLTKEEYLDIVTDQLSYLPPEVVIERINTDAKRDELIAPLWNIKKVAVANDLDKMMISKDIYQGKNYQKPTNLILYSHKLAICSGEKRLAIDATLGNGHDSFFLACNYQNVISFDIQDLAIRRSMKLLRSLSNITIHQDSFVNIKEYVSAPIDCLMYNLGFLPGSDHKIKTSAEDVVQSLIDTLPLLADDGICVITVYTKHDNGLERAAILHFLDSLSQFAKIFTDFESETVIEIRKKFQII